MGLQRVGHDWATCTFTSTSWAVLPETKLHFIHTLKLCYSHGHLSYKINTHTHTHVKSEITKCYNHTVSTPLRIFGPPPPPTTPFKGAQPPHHSLHWWWRSKYRQRDTGSSSFWHTNHEHHQSHGEPTRVSWMLRLTEAWHTYNQSVQVSTSQQV